MRLLIVPLLFHFIIAFPQCNPINTASSGEHRFVIIKNKLKGFINPSGEVVITPRFIEAGDFSEGLCAVRVGGRYGFIDTQGNICIEPIFDYATLFKEGLALVYSDGKPMFIGRDGRVVFQSVFKSMSHMENGRSYVITTTGKTGIINREGKLVIDTIYQEIGPFKDGLAIAYGFDHQEYDEADRKMNLQATAIDETGRRLFPYGKFRNIENYNEGYFEVQFPERKGGNLPIDAIVDVKGNTVFMLPKKQLSWISGGVYNGIIKLTLPKDKKANESYPAYVDLQGRKIFADRKSYVATEFNENVAFVGDDRFNYTLIDRRGKILSKEKYKIPGFSFQNPFHAGRGVVKFSDGTWGVIDTLGREVLRTQYTEIYPEELVNGEFFFFKGDQSSRGKVGVLNVGGTVIIPPVMDDFDKRGFVNGLLKALVEGKLTYFDANGKIVWQDASPEEQAQLKALNVDYMMRGYFYASGASTGHSSYSSPTKATTADGYTENALSLVVTENDSSSFYGIAKGIHINLVNMTSDTVVFSAQDKRLYMKTQAMDRNGNWRDIEYLPNSWCGNSYHVVMLPAGHLWSFMAPRYEGEFKTKLRVVVSYIAHTDKADPSAEKRSWAYRDKHELLLYSNEFDGSVNPGQFWRRAGYYPSGIMDPYNE